jgi:L-asparaginase
VPGLDQVADVTATSVQTLPGIELTFRHVVDLAETIDRALAGGLDGAVVTQGTDTLEETSFLLDLLVGDQSVVTTAAMRQADAVGADGPANLLAAVQVAASGLTRGAGVVIVMGDEVHAAAFCRKAHTSRPAGFVSDLGPIGWVTEGEPRILLAPRERFRLPERPSGDARVALVGTGLGDDGEVLRNLRPDRFDGLVVDAAGGGHVPHRVAEQIRGLAETMPVAIASRTRAGLTLTGTYGYPGGEIDLLERGAIMAGWLDAPKARVLMTALLAGGASRARIGRAFESFGGRWLVLQRTDA